MKVKRVDGLLFEKMLRNGLNNIKLNETKVNNMNVFPVPDGDTGSNMRMTLENGIKCAKSNSHLGDYAASLSEGMLMGARGNSGVILSQIFKGFAEELKRDSIIDAKEFTEGFIRAYKTAYSAVVKPVEGTLLTVAREGIEHIKEQTGRGMYIDTFFTIYLAELKKTLAITPDLLACLKEANVLDSGGMGYVIIIEGMLRYLHGEVIEATDEEIIVKENETVDTGLFSEYSELDYGYCMEFILQLLASRIKVNSFNQNVFVNELNDLGESLVVVKEGTRVKVHIHTKKPARVINYVQTYGEFISFKLENMSLQHSQLIAKTEVTEPVEEENLAKIAIVNGEDIKQVYSDLGCHIILDGGKTMNTSSEEIVKAIARCHSQKIVIFTNNKNIELACEQAIKVVKQDNIHIIRSSNILEGYYALAMDEVDNPNLDYRIKQMENGLDCIKTITLFTSIRDCTINGVDISKDDNVAIMDGEVLASDDDYIDAIIDALEKCEDVDSKTNCIILKGFSYKYDDEKLLEKINDEYPSLEVTFMDGSMLIYDAIIGLI